MQEVSDLHLATIEALALAIDAKDRTGKSHIRRVQVFAAGLAIYIRSGFRGAGRVSFWLLIAFLLIAYFAAAFGPPPPNVTTLAWSALALWLLIPWARWADR